MQYFCRGDWLPKEQIMALVHLSKENRQSQHTRFLLIIGAFVLLLGLCLAGLAVLIKKKLSQYKWTANLVEECKKYLFWNCFIRVLLQSYLDCCVSVALIYMVKEGAGWNWARYILAGFLTFLIALVPLFFFRFLQLMHEDELLEDTETVQKYGTQWSTLPFNDIASLQYYTVFLVRRLVFAFVSVHLGSRNGGLVLIVVCYISMA